MLPSTYTTIAPRLTLDAETVAQDVLGLGHILSHVFQVAAGAVLISLQVLRLLAVCVLFLLLLNFQEMSQKQHTANSSQFTTLHSVYSLFLKF